jgi:tripartite-type tricarboxylate transporter receptor subunit TctC
MTRHLLAALVAVLPLAATLPAQAQDYPTRNITVIVPFPAGGASDTAARIVTAKMQATIGQSVVIDNRAGANGSLGATAMKQAQPDGYTVLVGSIGVFAINPVLYKNLRYDPLKDFDLLSVLVRTPNVLVVTPSFPAKDVKELIAHLKQNPEKVSFASSGSGSSDHLTAALFWQKTGTTGIHVPYRGGGPAINDLIAGHALASFQNLGAVAQHIRAGRLRALAVTSGKRAAALPDVPTIAEAGVAGLEIYSWQAAAAPKGLPASVKAKLEAEFAAAAKAPEVQSKFEDIGFEVVANSGAEFTKFLTEETARWKQVVETGKITAE